MTEEERGQALLRAVVENPLCDTVRLVYADWLEENGEPDRAGLIRWHVERGVRYAFSRSNGGRVGFIVAEQRLGPAGSGEVPRWKEVVIAAWDELPGCSGATAERGFVSGVETDLSGWMTYGDRLRRSHPLEWVTLEGKRPYACGDSPPDMPYRGFMWCEDPTPGEATDYYGVPRCLFRLMTGHDRFHPAQPYGARACKFYDGAGVALADLSRACLEWAVRFAHGAGAAPVEGNPAGGSARTDPGNVAWVEPPIRPPYGV